MIPIRDWPIEYLILFAAGFVFVLAVLSIVSSHNKRSINNLRRKYIVLHGGLSRTEASKALDRQIELLQRKHPGQNYIWYIEKAIYDLNRDRRV